MTFTKRCPSCDEHKTADLFGKDKQGKFGLTSYCKSCNAVRQKAMYDRDKESRLAKHKIYREAHKEKDIARAKEWAEKNRERSRQIKSAWKKRNPEIVRRHAREARERDPEKAAKLKKERAPKYRATTNAAQKKRREKIDVRLSANFGNQFRSTLRETKNRKTWTAITGYDVAELKAHLEAQFSDGMSWDNYGLWHIDHIRPVSSFCFSEDPKGTARECWALSNLQPLWALDNIRKYNKWNPDQV